MSQAEVFKPANGQPLFIRDNISEGNPEKGIYPNKSTSRPSTHNNSRFGQLSLASFFTRHNPHPTRVRHIKGLLDSPICSVVDSDDFDIPNPKLNFPPNNYNESKLKSAPGNAINVNSQLYPMNTITGLQNYRFKEKADPNFGIVPVTDAWREELQYLTQAALIPHPKIEERPQSQQKKSMYSEKTGRLVPPPSRAMSRGNSRGYSRSRRGERPWEHIVEENDLETKVFSMLFQILGASCISDVKQWLCSAPSQEKEMMLSKIRSVILENPPVEYLVEENHRSAPGTGYQDNMTQTLAPLQEEADMEKVVERLSIVDGQYTKEVTPASRERNTINEVLRKSQVSPLPDINQKPVADEMNLYDLIRTHLERPPTSQVFQPRPSSKGPMMNGGAGMRLPPASPQTMSQPNFPTQMNGEPRLRYTSQGQRDPAPKAWYPSDSMA
ncbi:uncharacterized protein C4orf17-like isoform X1 [Lineus longissimus]